ncbi:DUF3237 family protein [Methylobacterium terricola]|nr:DUF3237 family protein [Methylobacterium terricola]
MKITVERCASEGGAPDLAWLTRVLAVGVGQRLPEGPVYDVYGVM